MKRRGRNRENAGIKRGKCFQELLTVSLDDKCCLIDGGVMYLFSPLDQHYDKGFGAVADSFYDAAITLKEQYHRSRSNGHLPICYLFRHSIELFLKGSIIIVHQGLNIPYGDKLCTSEPTLPGLDKKGNIEQKKIYNIHDVNVLYKYLSGLLDEKKAELDNIYCVWRFSDDFAQKVEQLEKMDSSSAYFRYPKDKKTFTYEKDKSAFKETTVEDVMAMAIKSGEPMKSMKTVSLLGKDIKIFVHDDSFTDKAMNLLAEIADEVSSCHFALMSKISGGYI
jgi:hypothetical protein